MDINDIEHARQVDLLKLMSDRVSLKQVTQGEYAGACPFCGGEDRFHVVPATGKWYCRQCTPRGGDAIDYVRRRDDIWFWQAVVLVLKGAGVWGCNPHIGAKVSASVEPPNARWQRLMSQYVSGCTEALRSSSGAQGLDWLHQRGLTDITVFKANLGYDVQERAIVIPIVVQDILWAIKIRHLYGQPKYRYARGSRTAIPYPVAQLTGKPSLLLCEGEFDALLLVQEAGDLVDVLTFGSATARLSSQWFSQLQSYTQIAVVMDGDPAGESAVAYWLSLFPQAVRLLPPAKDITAAYCAGFDLHSWISESLKMLA